MLIETSIYVYPRKEADMDIEPEKRTWEKTSFIFNLDEVVGAYRTTDDFNPGIQDPTMLYLRDGGSIEVQISYSKFVELWKNYKNKTNATTA